MHMFQQFYKEFTPELLKDFYAEDKLNLTKLVKHKAEIRVDDGIQKDQNGDKQDNLSETEKK